MDYSKSFNDLKGWKGICEGNRKFEIRILMSQMVGLPVKVSAGFALLYIYNKVLKLCFELYALCFHYAPVLPCILTS